MQKGKELSSDVYEANIVLNDKTMATLPKIGYHMLNDQLVMYNHVTEEKVVISRDFHFLKAVKFGDDYKLTFYMRWEMSSLNIKNMTYSIQTFRIRINS
ncbi:hypothetical protein [Wolbachia endosymbiont of Brugia pahangi]|uniref:hypothetical protein n=1 Tax=Wolbachia endosymbiont of Brugia pahangi TaxID=96495 RepID=UPI001435CBF8|nr:hypothetical protein [Wolbachia endosymbiont of Brugia pahangi]QIT35722.1 hypothetical protein WBP_0986 [Wolbachia endosymbiont of Brugia pahangi]